MPVLYLNEWTYHHTYFEDLVEASYIFFETKTAVTKFQGNLLSGALNITAWENLANIALYIVGPIESHR